MIPAANKLFLKHSHLSRLLTPLSAGLRTAVSGCFVLCCLCVSAPVLALTVQKIDVESGPDISRVSIQTDQEPRYQVTDATGDKGFFYVDFYGVTKNYKRDLLSAEDNRIQADATVRYIDFRGFPEFGVLRVVMYAKPGTTCELTKLEQGTGVSLVCRRTGPGGDASSTTATAGIAHTTPGQVQRQAVTLDTAPAAEAVISSPGAGAASSVPRSLAAPPSKPTTKKLVIIDPGHGGANSGARSRALVGGKPAQEKELTLAFAMHLKNIIDQSGNMLAIVTRSDDSNVSLHDRVRMAESLGDEYDNFDLFISLHMNDGDGNASARGFEIYYLNEKGAATAAAKALEEKENRDVGNPTSKHTKSIVEGLLSDLHRGKMENMKHESQLLCQHIKQAMTKLPHFKSHDRGIKSANFVVLKNFAMPAVLLEVGFITNTEDLKLLVDPRFQQATALMIYYGIANYFAQNDPTFRPVPIRIGGSK